MAKKMLIDATHAEETRVVVVDGTKVEEFDFETENKRQLAGNIYLAKVTRVEPSLQAAFVDYGGNRHGFLAFSEIHADYYQIPVADREKLLEEERAYAKAMAEEEEKPKPKRRAMRSRRKTKAAEIKSDDAVLTKEPEGEAISGMDVVDLDGNSDEGNSPMVLVHDTPVETPASDDTTADSVAEDAPNDDQPPADTSEASSTETGNEDTSDDDDAPLDATEKDDRIVSVADDDAPEEIRPPRKPRPRRYKIQEVVKVRQILLVQVVKEERGNKGAALTTYLSLAGRYCVLMPNTARGGGISRKIVNPADRKKLKAIANEVNVPDGAGLIVRTAGAKRTKSEIHRDYEYLQRLWEEIRKLTLESIAPAKIYEEGNLIKRSIRDLYNRDIDEVIVSGEAGYHVAKDFMKMIMPSHAKNVKLYKDTLPLFARFQVESYLAGMFNPTVQLKSGGYIVIGVTEALVAIDVNSGRATKQGSIEETALNTNLEASDEVARQLRLRDLAGLIVIDYIDMEERRNNNAVEKRLKDRLKTDRARIQVGRISGFGLMEMSRQRLRPGMIEATTQPCSHCHGTGLIRSDENLALSILRQIEEEGTRGRSREVVLKAPIGITNYLMNNKREHIAQIEARYGLSVRIEGEPFMVSPDFSIEKLKTASRVVKKIAAPVVSVDASIMDGIDEDVAAEASDAPAENPAASNDEQQQAPKKRRRRRRRRRGGNGQNGDGQTEDGPNADSQAADGQPQEAATADATPDDAPAENSDASVDASVDAPVTEAQASETPEAPVAEEKPKRAPRKRAPRKKKVEAVAEESVNADEVKADEPAPEADVEEKPKKKRAPRKRVVKKADKPADNAKDADAPATEEADAEEKPKPKKRTPRKRAVKKPVEETPKDDAPVEAAKAEEAKVEKAPEPVQEEVKPEPKPEPTPEPAPKPKSDTPKKKGWWSLGR